MQELAWQQEIKKQKKSIIKSMSRNSSHTRHFRMYTGNDVVITWYVECEMWNDIRNYTRRSLNIHYKQSSNF